VLRAAAPHEGCALLLGLQHNAELSLERIWPCCNSWLPAEQRRQRFLLDPREQLHAQRWARAHQLQVIGAAHSHPSSPAVPSATDLELCFGPTLMLIRSGLTEPALSGDDPAPLGDLPATVVEPLQPWRAWWIAEDTGQAPQELPLRLSERAGHLGE